MTADKSESHNFTNKWMAAALTIYNICLPIEYGFCQIEHESVIFFSSCFCFRQFHFNCKSCSVVVMFFLWLVFLLMSLLLLLLLFYLSQMQSTLDIIEQSWNEENERLLCAKAIQLIHSKLVYVISLIRQTTNY